MRRYCHSHGYNANADEQDFSAKKGSRYEPTPQNALVVDVLEIFRIAGIHSQHQILSIIQHCIFLLIVG